ncbi:XAC2610-related protein [Cupriavidus basilensis]|uniref:XAC2610-related protein n=1 Tax=Cupriavidus basilensis TaxID=68895 RepID=UPI0012E065F5|nr:hypothetical protein [Cupriavidus basilensis]
MKEILSFWMLWLSIACCNAKTGQEIKFSPTPGVVAVIAIDGNLVSINICGGRKCNNTEGNLYVGNPGSVNLGVGDYNFDGNTDFSLWYLDEGKGTYTIHRIFLFSKSAGRFGEYLPACGDEFVNLKVDKKNRRLISTYWADNEPKVCFTYPQENHNGK